MSAHHVVIQKEQVLGLLRALNACYHSNSNRFENPINCLHNNNNASVIGINRSIKAFIIIDHLTQESHTIDSRELFHNFQKDRGSESTHHSVPNPINAIFKRSILDDENIRDASDYFSASPSIEEGLCE